MYDKHPDKVISLYKFHQITENLILTCTMRTKITKNSIKNQLLYLLLESDLIGSKMYYTLNKLHLQFCWEIIFLF